MIPFIYVFLEVLMLIVLFKSGVALKKDYRILSRAGVSAIAVYTFVMGLRFGRGIDYNVYWGVYNRIERGVEYEKSYLYNMLNEVMISLNIPFQVLIIIMSFTFILGVLLLLENYRDTAPYALPLFVFFSQGFVDNMVRWYFAYSFFLIGFSFLIYKGKKDVAFVLFTVLSCFIHYAFVLVPIIFCLIYKLRKPILKPVVAIPLFLGVYLLFSSELMLNFLAMIQALTFVSNSAYESYTENAEYWLTGGFGGLEKAGKIGLSLLLFLSLLTYFGYKSLLKRHEYIFAYNIFIFGLLLYPLSLKIELIERYDQVFFFFRAIMLANILCVAPSLWKRNATLLRQLLFFLLIWTNYGPFISPFTNPNRFYMFVWDQSNETSDFMIDAWNDFQYDVNKKQNN